MRPHPRRSPGGRLGRLTDPQHLPRPLVATKSPHLQGSGLRLGRTRPLHRPAEPSSALVRHRAAPPPTRLRDPRRTPWWLRYQRTGARQHPVEASPPGSRHGSAGHEGIPNIARSSKKSLTAPLSSGSSRYWVTASATPSSSEPVTRTRWARARTAERLTRVSAWGPRRSRHSLVVHAGSHPWNPHRRRARLTSPGSEEAKRSLA